MKLIAYFQNNELTIALSGEIDHHSAKEYLTGITAKLEAYTPEKCTLDFQDVTFMDSSGIAVVINAMRYMTRLNGRLAVSGVRAQPYKVFHTSGIEKLVSIQEAVK